MGISLRRALRKEGRNRLVSRDASGYAASRSALSEIRLTAAKGKTATLSRQNAAGKGWGTLGTFIGFWWAIRPCATLSKSPLLAKSARSGAPIFIGLVRPSDDRYAGQLSRSILAQVEEFFRVQMEES